MRNETIVEHGICGNIYGINVSSVYNYADYCSVLDCYVTICMTYMCSTVIYWICGGEVFWWWKRLKWCDHRVYIPVMGLIGLGSMFEILRHCLLLCMWSVENEDDAGM